MPGGYDHPIAAVIVRHGANDLSAVVDPLLDNGMTVVVVDNNPGRPISAIPRDGLLLVQSANNGYGAALNKGAKTLVARRYEPSHLLLLNDDIVIASHVAQDMVKSLPSASLLGLNGWSRLPRAGISSARCGGYRYPAGSALLAERQGFELIGGFDEEFFLYFEEVDLALRLEMAGLTVDAVDLVGVEHKGAGSSSSVSAACAFEMGRSQSLFARKWLTGSLHRTIWSLHRTTVIVLGRLRRHQFKEAGAFVAGMVFGVLRRTSQWLPRSLSGVRSARR